MTSITPDLPHPVPRSERLRALAGRSGIQHVVALVIFLTITVGFFHGMMEHLNSSVFVGPNDETYAVRSYWGAEQDGKTPFTWKRDLLNGAPEGLPFAPAVQIANFVQPGFVWLLRSPLGLLGAFNLFLLLGFVLSGFSVYLLVSHLGFGFVPGLFAGYAVAFNPWMIERAYAGHAGYMHAWVFALLTAVLLRTRRTRALRDAALSGLIFALAFYVSSYYGLLAALLVGVFWVVDALFQCKSERLWTATLACVQVGVALVAFAPAVVAGLLDRPAVSATVSNRVQALQSGGATPMSYILPSLRHPVLSEITNLYGPEADFHWSENTLYLGVTTLVLALIAIVMVIRAHPATQESGRRFVLVFSGTLALTAFVFSLKREIDVFGITVPMPSYLIGQFTYFWRVYARFGVIVLFALALLAAFTLSVLGRRHRGQLLALLFCGLLVFDFWPGRVPIYSTNQPQPYAEWLAHQPRGIVANYPLPTDSPAAIDLLAHAFFDQRHHGQPFFAIFGSGYGGTREDAIRILARYIDTPETPGILAAEGVRYVLLHDDVYRQEGVTPPQPDPRYYRFLTRIGDVRAYSLQARPAALTSLLEANSAEIAQVQGLTAPTITGYGAGFNAPEPGPAGESRWLIQDGQISISSAGATASRLRLESKMFSLREPRTIEVVARGKVLARAAVQTFEATVSLGPFTLPAGTSQIELRTAPGPSQIGSGDTRMASVYLGPLAFVPLADLSHSIADG